MKSCLILGTRPEIIKLCSLIRVFQKNRLDFFIIHSNQHYSESMDKVFFRELNLPSPKYNLGIGSAEHGNQTGRMLIAIEDILLKEKPDIVLAEGDTNTVLAGILAAAKQNIRCGHIEAGLRSYDRRMPEEKNRILCDSISDIMFCPTDVQKEILLNEGIPAEKIFVTGNTIADAVLENMKIADSSDIMKRLNVSKKGFVLFTAHRALNVDFRDALEQLLLVIKKAKEYSALTVVYPIHPRTKAKLSSFGLSVADAIITEPLGYLDFLCLEKNSKFIITDSGGVQEEACILGVPCMTIRENTERPETVAVGANRIVGLDIAKLKEAFDYFSDKHTWKNPLGDGKAAERIYDILTKKIKSSL